MVKTLKLGPTNCYFLKAESGYLLIDTSLPEYLEAFQKSLERVDVKLSEINYLLIARALTR